MALISMEKGCHVIWANCERCLSQAALLAAQPVTEEADAEMEEAVDFDADMDEDQPEAKPKPNEQVMLICPHSAHICVLGVRDRIAGCLLSQPGAIRDP